MKKRYIFIAATIIITIAYVDLIDNFRQIDKAIAEFTGVKTVTLRDK